MKFVLGLMFVLGLCVSLPAADCPNGQCSLFAPRSVAKEVRERFHERIHRMEEKHAPQMEVVVEQPIETVAVSKPVKEQLAACEHPIVEESPKKESKCQEHKEPQCNKEHKSSKCDKCSCEHHGKKHDKNHGKYRKHGKKHHRGYKSRLFRSR